MKLTATAKITTAVEKYQEKHVIDHKQAGDGWIDHHFLARVALEVNQPLTGLLRGSGVFIAPPEPKPGKSPEYLAFMQKLRAEAQEKEYRQLAGIQDDSGPMFGGSDAKQVKEELTTILNFAVSVFAVGFALWYWAKWWDPASRTLLAILGSLVVLVAEVVVYASYRSKVEEARRIEQTKTHVTKPLDTQDMLLQEKQEHKQPTKPTKAKKTQTKSTALTTGSQTSTLRPRIQAH